MKTRKINGAGWLLAVLVLGACDETSTGPEVGALTADELQELAVLEDETSFAVALEVATVSEEVATLDVSAASTGHTFQNQAGQLFASALEALRTGDRRRALADARAARTLIVQAMLATRGPHAVEELIDRIEDLSVTDLDDDVFDDPESVSDVLTDLARSARDRLAAGDSLAAGERALLGEQWARHRRGRLHHPGDIRPERARLAVALAGTAVSLAERLIAQGDAPSADSAPDASDHRNRWLHHARRMLERAERALENGNLLRAVHFAQHAHWAALKAVLLPGGVTEAELEAMVQLAEELYAQAEVSLGDDATVLEITFLERAARLIEIGKHHLEEGHRRGVAALWRASVICSWLLG